MKITLPAPIAAGPLGDLAAFELSAHSPVDTPSGKAYDKAVKAAAKLDAKVLVAALDDDACDLGTIPKKTPKLSGSAKKAYETAHEQALHARKARVAYLYWLTRAVLAEPAGRKRVLEIARSDRYDPEVRATAAFAFHEGVDDNKELLAFAKALDVRTWNTKDTEERHLDRVYLAAVRCWHAADPKGAFTALSPLCKAELVKKQVGKVRAEVVIDSLDKDSDPRWVAAIAKLTVGRLDMAVLMALTEFPPDPIVIDPVIAYLEDDFFHDDAVELLARLADKAPAKIVPWLAKALADSWMHWERVFAGFARSGDPSTVDIIAEWVADNDTPDVRKAANKIYKLLGKPNKKSKTAGAPAKTLLPKKAEPAPRERPTLVYEKIKADKKPKIPAIAKLEKDYRALFAKAGLGDHYEAIAQRAVLLFPTRVDESKIAIGAMKLGGHPDLPAGTKWPRVKGDPMSFVGQLVFDELAPHLPKDTILPKTGRVAIFVDADAETGHYIEHAKAIVSETDDELVRHEVPEDYVAQIYQACTVACIPTIRLPSSSHPAVTGLLDDEQEQTYEKKVYVTDDALPQVMGYRDHGYEAEVPAKSQMLLQLTGDSQTDMEFGDSDYIAFYVPTKNLAKGDFTKVSVKIGD